jgi:2-keto-4-pentenoate hydratase/2-oxohepta-3-ene-1,7-dioic acid hydratase in catechol pathway
MKLARFLTEAQKVCMGAICEGDEGSARLLSRGFPEAITVTKTVRRIQRLLAPVEPPNILALGLNYRRHAEETRMDLPETPVLFMKATNSLIGPGQPILLPAAGPDCVDYEGELAVVIGRRVRNASPEEAWGAVLGYTCANDVSARDWQFAKQSGQWIRGKSFDTFCPLGPWIVTPSDLPDPQNVRLRTLVNGTVVQEESTRDMIFPIPAIISDLSRTMTLLPGTVILTGTPRGVGFTRRPPVFLRDGDTVTVDIEGIGSLTNPVLRENASAVHKESFHKGLVFS